MPLRYKHPTHAIPPDTQSELLPSPFVNLEPSLTRSIFLRKPYLDGEEIVQLVKKIAKPARRRYHQEKIMTNHEPQSLLKIGLRSPVIYEDVAIYGERGGQVYVGLEKHAIYSALHVHAETWGGPHAKNPVYDTEEEGLHATLDQITLALEIALLRR